MMGWVRDEPASGSRSLPLGRYVIFHEALENGIPVVRVLHSGRDVDAWCTVDNAGSSSVR